VAVQFEDAWERKDIEFDADLEDAAYTQADPGLLELVWTNLLSNAVKFTSQGGSITLRQTRANGKIYVSVTDTEAMDALMELCKLEGIIPAIESAHAVAYASKYAKELTEKLGAAEAKDKTMIICLSGRGDKDVNTIADYLAGKGYLN